MVSKKHQKLGLAFSVIFTAGVVQATPLAAQTTQECTAYSIRVCVDYPSLGYSTLKECRLQEYANCMAGAPPIEPVAFKPEAPMNAGPSQTAAASKASAAQS